MSRAGLRTAAVILATLTPVVVAAGALAFWYGARPSATTLARRAYDRGDWEGAEEALRAEVRPDRIHSADPEAARIYARALARLGRDTAARVLYLDRLASAEMEPEDQFLKGLLMVREGKLDMAFDVWGRSLGRGADHPEMLDHYSRLGARLHRLDPALDAARRLARHPGWEARGAFILGSLSDLIDDPPGAVAALEDALRREPEARGAVLDAAHYRKVLARNLLGLGRGGVAARYLAESKAPDAESEWLLSRAYLQQGRMAEAAEALTRSGSYGDEHRLAPEPSPYVGSSACVPCHREIGRQYERTRHARTFTRGAGLLDLPRTNQPVPDPDDPKVRHEVVREGDRIEATTDLGDRASRMVVEYAFGTPERYVTMIARDSERGYRALRVSHYQTAADSGWGATAGDVGHSDAVEDRIGQRIGVRDGVVRCLHCHVTRSRDFRDPAPDGGPSPASADRAIGCERCHGPGGNHIQAIDRDLQDAKGGSDFAIASVPAASGSAASGHCIECHTVGVTSEIEQDPDDPRYVRSPGVTLAASRCAIESRGALSCMTCHAPHREAEHSATSYEAKCLACHAAPASRKPTATATATDTPCPVNPAKDCLACHMPKVPMPTLHTTLTDHYIRVHREAPRRNPP